MLCFPINHKKISNARRDPMVGYSSYFINSIDIELIYHTHRSSLKISLEMYDFSAM